MDKILEELKNMEEINSEYKKNVKNEQDLESKEQEVKEMYEKLQLKMVGTEDREIALKEYEEKKSKIEEIRSKKEASDVEIKKNFEEQKKAIIKEIDKKIASYEKIEKEKVEMENAKKARDEEVSKLESQKNAYSKIAQNSKKDIANILEKLNNGEHVSMDRLTDAQNEYKANSKKIINIENQIKELNDKKFEISNDIENKQEEISDLQYLKTRLFGTKINEIDKIKDDPFISKYGKEEPTKEENKEEKTDKEEKENKDQEKTDKEEKENKEQEKTDKEEKEDKEQEKANKEEKEDKEQEKTDKEKEETPEKTDKEKEETPEKTNKENGNSENLNNNSKKENPKDYRDKIILDAEYNSLLVNNERKDFLGVFIRDGKMLKEDSDLAIGSLFAGDKKMAKYIDYGLLKALDDKDRNLALEYLNVIRGGGIKSASESAEILKNAVDIKYKFGKDLNNFLSFKRKRIARKAAELGIAEVEGINEKSLAQRIKGVLSKAKNIKLFNVKEKPKEIAGKIEKKVIENGLGNIKVDNRDNHIEKTAQEQRKKDVEKIKQENARKVSPDDVEVLPPEDKGNEIGE